MAVVDSLRSITEGLGASPSSSEVDYYNEARKYPLVYDPQNDPEVVCEMNEMEKEISLEKAAKKAANHVSDSDSDADFEVVPGDVDASSSESDDSDSDEDEDEDCWADDPFALGPTERKSKGTAKGKSKGKGKKAKRVFTVIDKVSPTVTFHVYNLLAFQIHAVAVYILRSEVRRKRARKLIRRKVSKKHRHLVFIRGIRIRWNTTLAEMERARLLRAVRLTCAIHFSLINFPGLR